MKHITFWLDFISPFAYLAFERLPQALEGCSVAVSYKPILFGALLKHHSHKGPAEIEPKRAWTFRHVNWMAAQWGIALQTPAVHPFNPLGLARLALACADEASPSHAATPNRYVIETLFHHVWRGQGADVNDAQRMAAVSAKLQPAHDPGSEAVKAALRTHTQAAIAAGVFGVPTFELHGADGAPSRMIWGLDALPMLRAAVLGEPWFEGPAWEREGAPRAGVVRGPA